MVYKPTNITGGPILDVHGILRDFMELERDFMELERDAHGISADLPGCFNSYNWLINMVFWNGFTKLVLPYGIWATVISPWATDAREVAQ